MFSSWNWLKLSLSWRCCHEGRWQPLLAQTTSLAKEKFDDIQENVSICYISVVFWTFITMITLAAVDHRRLIACYVHWRGSILSKNLNGHAAAKSFHGAEIHSIQSIFPHLSITSIYIWPLKPSVKKNWYNIANGGGRFGFGAIRFASKCWCVPRIVAVLDIYRSPSLRFCANREDCAPSPPTRRFLPSSGFPASLWTLSVGRRRRCLVRHLVHRNGRRRSQSVRLSSTVSLQSSLEIPSASDPPS